MRSSLCRMEKSRQSNRPSLRRVPKSSERAAKVTVEQTRTRLSIRTRNGARSLRPVTCGEAKLHRLHSSREPGPAFSRFDSQIGPHLNTSAVSRHAQRAAPSVLFEKD